MYMYCHCSFSFALFRLVRHISGNLNGAQHEEFNFDEFPDFLTGGVGFGLANYTALFDNIRVTGDSIPNSRGFAVTFQGKLTTTWGNLKLAAEHR